MCTCIVTYLTCCKQEIKFKNAFDWKEKSKKETGYLWLCTFGNGYVISSPNSHKNPKTNKVFSFKDLLIVSKLLAGREIYDLQPSKISEFNRTCNPLQITEFLHILYPLPVPSVHLTQIWKIFLVNLYNLDSKSEISEPTYVPRLEVYWSQSHSTSL